MRTAQRVRDLTASPTLALDARVKALVAAGADVVNMAVGEPDFPTPAGAIEAAVEAARSGTIRYTPAAGRPDLRATLARHLAATRGVPFAPEDVVVCHSGKHALSGALLAWVDEGDEVLLPLPCWVSYVELVRLAGGVPVPVPPGPDGATPDLEALAAAVTERTVGVLVNSPCNPSGILWSAAELGALCDLARARDLWILSDEIYRRLVFDGGSAPSPLELAPDLADRIAIIDGASKSFAMTGYRIGWLAGPRELADAVGRLHSQTTGSPNDLSQRVLRAVLETDPPEVEAMRAVYERRRDRLHAGLEALGLACPRPMGAFYAFPSVAPYTDARGTAGFCEDLLEQEGLALVPGDAFLLEGHVRLSFALGDERIDEALARLGRFLASR